LNGVLATVLPHSSAIRPLSFFMSRNAHVSWSTSNGSAASVIGTRTTSLSGV
jgi:hypothetical protein